MDCIENKPALCGHSARSAKFKVSKKKNSLPHLKIPGMSGAQIFLQSIKIGPTIEKKTICKRQKMRNTLINYSVIGVKIAILRNAFIYAFIHGFAVDGVSACRCRHQCDELTGIKAISLLLTLHLLRTQPCCGVWVGTDPFNIRDRGRKLA